MEGRWRETTSTSNSPEAFATIFARECLWFLVPDLAGLIGSPRGGWALDRLKRKHGKQASQLVRENASWGIKRWARGIEREITQYKRWGEYYRICRRAQLGKTLGLVCGVSMRERMDE